MATSSYEIKAGSLTMTEYAGQPTLGIAMKKRREVSVGRCVQATLLFALGVSPSAAADIHKDCQALQIAACTEVLRANPADTSALGNRGIGFRIAGQYDRAVADLTAAIDLQPENCRFLPGEGFGLREQGGASACHRRFERGHQAESSARAGAFWQSDGLGSHRTARAFFIQLGQCPGARSKYGWCPSYAARL
jgi:hypothetical protein